MFLFFCFLLFLSPHSVPTFTNLQEETLIKIADVLDEVRVDNRIHRYIFQNYLYGYNPLFMKKTKHKKNSPLFFISFGLLLFCAVVPSVITYRCSATTIEAARIFARSCSWEPPCRVRSVIYASPHNPNMKQKNKRISLEMYR